MKESQRRMIWRADRLFAAAAALNDLAVNDSSYSHQAWELDIRAHQLVRDAGFKDAPTFDLSAWCAQVCADYSAGILEVIPFE